MSTPGKQTIAVNYYFTQEELENRIFSKECRSDKAPFMRAFRDYMRGVGVNVVTIDQVDFHDPSVTHVLYFDYSWRSARTDRFLASVPFEKRALVMIEPSLVNPSLYFTAHYRGRFKTVFTWALKLINKNPSYTRINVPVGAEPLSYRVNPFKQLTFADKRFLVAVSANRWSYMPHSAYATRLRAYKHFDQAGHGPFDLYGIGWDAPRVIAGLKLSAHRFASYRGPIAGGYDAKVKVIAGYKFALCLENNASEPGYISEKILDCFCARCVPVYYGWKGAGDYLPKDAWIDLRDFRSLEDLETHLNQIDEVRYARYIQAIDLFMQSEQVGLFSMSHFFKVISDRLGAPGEGAK